MTKIIEAYLGKNKKMGENMNCKICGNDSPLSFSLMLSRSCSGAVIHEGYDNIKVNYYKCNKCSFVFTDFFDNWSYKEFSDKIYNNNYIKMDPDFSYLRPSRTANVMSNFFRDYKDLGFLDYGGGNGVFSNSLKKYGFKIIDSWDINYDKKVLTRKYNIVVAFEVFEHLPNPLETFTSMVNLLDLSAPAAIFVGTSIPQNCDYLNNKYVAPRNGHMSIYSLKSLAVIARKFDAVLLSNGVTFHGFLFNDFPIMNEEGLKIVYAKKNMLSIYMSSIIKKVNILKRKCSRPCYNGLVGKFLLLKKGIGFAFSRLLLHSVPMSISRHNLLLIFLRFLLKVCKFPSCEKFAVKIIQPNGLGDAVLNISFINGIKKIYKCKDEDILLVLDKSMHGFEKIMYGDVSVFFVNFQKYKINLFYKIVTALKICSIRSEVCLSNLRWRNFSSCDLLVYLSNSTEKFLPLYHNRHIRANCEVYDFGNKYGTKHFLEDTDPSSHELIRLEKILHQIDLSHSFSGIEMPRIHYKRIEDGRKYITFFLGAKDRYRMWSIENFVEVAKYFLKKKYYIYFFAGKSDERFYKNLHVLLKENLKDYCESYSVRFENLSPYELCDFLGNSDLVLAGDTGPGHLSVALNVPTVIILGGGHFGNYFPYPSEFAKKNIRCVYSTMSCFSCDWDCACKEQYSCVTKISVYSVISSMNELVCNSKKSI